MTSLTLYISFRASINSYQGTNKSTPGAILSSVYEQTDGLLINWTRWHLIALLVTVVSIYIAAKEGLQMTNGPCQSGRHIFQSTYQLLSCLRAVWDTAILATSLGLNHGSVAGKDASGMFQSCRSCSCLQIDCCSNQKDPQSNNHPCTLLPFIWQSQEREVSKDVWRRLNLVASSNHLSFPVFLFLDFVTPCSSIPDSHNTKYHDIVRYEWDCGSLYIAWNEIMGIGKQHHAKLKRLPWKGMLCNCLQWW